MTILKKRLDSLEERIDRLEQDYGGIIDRMPEEFEKIRADIPKIVEEAAERAVGRALREWLGDPKDPPD